MRDIKISELTTKVANIQSSGVNKLHIAYELRDCIKNIKIKKFT